MLPARIHFSYITCLALAACGGASTPMSPAVADALLDFDSGPAATPHTGVDDVDFADLLNGLRASRGLDGVSYDARLDAAAQKHAQDMVDRDYFDHVTDDTVIGG